MNGIHLTLLGINLNTIPVQYYCSAPRAHYNYCPMSVSRQSDAFRCAVCEQSCQARNCFYRQCVAVLAVYVAIIWRTLALNCGGAATGLLSVYVLRMYYTSLTPRWVGGRASPR